MLSTVPELTCATQSAGGTGCRSGVLASAPTPAVGVDCIVENAAVGPVTTDEHIAVCIAEAVPVVVFFWNLPPASWVRRLHAAGAKVWLQIGSLHAAREAVHAGMDAVIVQG